MEADFLILADGAQVAGDKLYLLGGAWTTLAARQFPTTHLLSIATGITVEWMETNRRHDFKIEVRSEDENRVLAEIDGQFETGHPPGIPPGSAQPFLMALNVGILLERSGQYLVRLLLNGTEAKRRPFLVTGPAAVQA